MSCSRRHFVALVALAATACKRERDGTVEVTIAAAASLRAVAPALVAAFAHDHPRARIRLSYGASGNLRRRVEEGAPYDAVMMASAEPVDALVAAGLVVADSRLVVAKNELVLIAPADRPSTLTFATLDELGPDERLAIGEPGAVPAGQYARQALQRLGRWNALEGRLVLGGDVGAVLAYARRGEVAAAIVYSTEVQGIDDVKVLDRAKGAWAPSPEVVVGVVAEAAHANQAGSFLEFVASEEGRAIFAAHGFGPP